MPKRRDSKATRSARRGAGGDAQAPAKPRIKKLRIFAITAGLLLLAGVSTVFGMMMAVASELPKLEDREQYKVAKASVMYDDMGRVITTLRNNENRILVPSAGIAPVMKQAVVAVEDRRFYEHAGIDFRGIARAVVADTTGFGAHQGASTITQQFVKNALTANNNRTVMEKLREAALAYHLENKWTKDKILTEYLNSIYFGNGAYGIESAAETYFSKEAHPGCAPHCAEQLAPWEAALLAGVIQSPAYYDPAVYPANAMERRNEVLLKMYQQGFITKQIYDKGTTQAVPSSAEITRPSEKSAAPYFSTWVRQQLVDKYDAGAAFGGGLRVHTTLDLDLQRAAERSILGTLPFGGPTAALVAIENKTGKVRALVGGFDYNSKPFNLATQGHRQPGSSFKPFTLVTALKRGYSLGYTLQSAKIKTPGATIENYENSYAGVISLLDATTTSDNTAYVRMGWKVGVHRVANTAHKMGISSPLSVNTAMVLGGLRDGVTPLEMAYAYTSLANSGRKPVGSLAPDDNSPVAIEKVTQNGRLFRKQRDHTRYDRVFSANVGAQAREALQSVVSRGTGKKAAIAGFAAGKTGTTENYGDAWFVGFNDELTVAIWVGYPDGMRPMLTEFGGQPVAGGTYPALIWQNFMTNAMAILVAHKAGDKGPTDSVAAPVTVDGGGAGSGQASPANPGTNKNNNGNNGGGNNRQKAPAQNPQPAPAPKQPAPQPPADNGNGNNQGNGDGGAGGGAGAPG